MIDSSKILYVKLMQSLPGVELITFETLNVYSHFEVIFNKKLENDTFSDMCNKELELSDLFDGSINFYFTHRYIHSYADEVQSCTRGKEVLFSRKSIDQERSDEI